MHSHSEPDAECVDCGLGFAAGHPSMGNLLRWHCTSCDGKLVVHTKCGNCHRPIDRKTGIRGVFGRLSSPNTCEHCGEKVGLANDLPGSFGVRDRNWQPNDRRMLEHTSHRLRLAFVVVFYCAVTAFVGAFVGIMIGACLGAGLFISIEPTGPLLGLSVERLGSLILLLIIGAFAAAGAWYGWRHVDTEVSRKDPTPLP